MPLTYRGEPLYDIGESNLSSVVYTLDSERDSIKHRLSFESGRFYAEAQSNDSIAFITEFGETSFPGLYMGPMSESGIASKSDYIYTASEVLDVANGAVKAPLALGRLPIINYMVDNQTGAGKITITASLLLKSGDSVVTQVSKTTSIKSGLNSLNLIFYPYRSVDFRSLADKNYTIHLKVTNSNNDNVAESPSVTDTGADMVDMIVTLSEGYYD